MENIISTISSIETVSNVEKAIEKIGYDLAFPNLGIFIKNLKNTINIGNFAIAYYGIIIALAMLIAFNVVVKLSKKTKLSEDNIYDVFLIVIILGIIGARAYYVLFNWDYYQIRPYEILDIRAGGLAVFGGIIMSIIGVAIYSIIKKVNVIELVDVCMVGLPLGQAIGRYGNFFNMEAYGTYTNNIFAMRLRCEYLDKNCIDLTQLANMITEEGIEYIQAHPTFFYESTLNLVLFAILLYVFLKKYKFRGQILSIYLIGYGIIRFFVEGLRTDSLMYGNMRVSQIVAIVCVVVGIIIIVINVIKNNVLRRQN